MSQYKGKGRYPKYGKKVKLADFFDQHEIFSKATCKIYGKTEEILITYRDLLWKPTGDLIRFVLVITNRGPIVLMCSDLNQDPVIAIELYCIRIRIEIMFDMLKNVIGAFFYRFWSKKMPRHSRKPKKNKYLKEPSSANIETVKKCWESYERFVNSGAIALGLLQLIALKFTASVWEEFDNFIRTKSRAIPSERTVKHVIAYLILKNYLLSPVTGIIRLIQKKVFCKKLSHKAASETIKA